MNIKLSALLSTVALAAILVGCGTSPAPIVQNKEAMDAATALRAYFDQSKGDFKALSPADQAKAEKFVGGGPADVQKLFDYMKTSNKTAVKAQ